ncbi:MAG: AbfB domain-containing protein [Polyangiaceae bacterium]
MSHFLAPRLGASGYVCASLMAGLLFSCAASEAPVDVARSERALVLEPTPLGLPLAVPLFQGSDPLIANLTIPADAPSKGMWSATQSWPLNGLHSVLLPNGKVLTYGTPTGNASTQDGRYFDVWDPSQGFAAASHTSSFKADQANSFCSSSAFLANGTLLISGGNSPLDSSEFSSVNGGVVGSASHMADERWYATMLTLGDGRQLLLGGSTPYGALRAYQDPGAAINAGSVSMTPEVYAAGTGWRSLFGAYSREAFGPDFHRYWYPRAWVSPNGEVFGVSSETMWYLNPTADGSVRVAGAFKTGVNNTSKPNIGPTSSAVMFAPGRILQVGGNGYHDGFASPSSALATVIDINGAEPVLSETAPMSNARQWPSSTVLPDGRVVVTGGTRYGNNGGTDAVYPAELWNPATGTWQLGASAAQVRVYHSAAILMPNGTLLSTGGGAPGPVNNLNAELYYPPYLFKAQGSAAVLASRPQLTGINSLNFSYGQPLELDVADTRSISKVVLIGASQVTHSFNTAQRYVPLAFAQNQNRVTATLPTSAFQAPPGYYLAVVLDADAVPSVGVIVALGADTAAPPVTTALARGATLMLNSVNQAGYSVASDDAALGVLKALNANSSQTDLGSAQFVVRDGLADSRCVSLESATKAGQFLRHVNYRLRLAVNDGSALFKNDATFCPEAGLAGTGVTLRSLNFPANVLRHRALEMWLDPVPAPLDATFAADASFSVDASPIPVLPSVAAPPILAGTSASYAPVISVAGAQYQWSFADGTPTTALSTSPNVAHAFASPGTYLVTWTLQLSDGRRVVKTFVQAVYAALTSTQPRASSPLLLEPRSGAKPRLWVVNPDTDTVSVFDTANNAKLAEIAVGAAPRSVALAPDGRIWVVNRDAATLSLIAPATLSVATTLSLPRSSQPYGLVFAPNGSAAFVALSGSGQVLKLNVSTGAQLGSLNLGSDVRQLSVTGDSTKLLVSRFVTPAAAAEATAQAQTSATAQLQLVDPAAFTLKKTITLRFSDKVDGEVQARGLPNYLGAAVIAPDGRSAWLPSKQDNIARGSLRDGQNIDFQDTVRAISSRVDLDSQSEDYAGRIDHDNAGVASAVAFHPSGAYFFVALETSRQVAVVAAVSKTELFRVDVGRAPQALVVSPAGTELYVSNFMDRSVSVVDLQPLVGLGEFRATPVATVRSVATEKLAAQVLSGKQLFYDAKDPRLSRDAYLSCASCHEDGRHDGRTWDLTGLGEGLRNTISLRGRSGGQSLLHWSGNFDEVQDFEGQIRTLAQGSGLMTDADFNTGTRSQPLGLAKAGRSADLDAMAAYVKSLAVVAPSPFRNADGTLTTAAVSGRTLFGSSGCPTCHNGSTFADEGLTALRNIGTLKASSGKRLGATLSGIDTPSLRDTWSSAPYLHDGSAATLALAISAHNTSTLSGTNLSNVAAFVQQIDASEPGFAPPSGLTACAAEGAKCTIPSGKTATVYYGANTRFYSKQGVTGSITCSNDSFGDPIKGTKKACSYR